VRRQAIILSVLIIGTAPSARGQGPACGSVDPREGIRPEALTQVLVLGTQHLRRIEAFDPATLRSLLDALEAWEPDAIGVETLPPAEISAMEMRSAYGPVLGAFAGEELTAGRLAREHLGIGWEAAFETADSLLGELESASSARRPELRRELVPVLMGAYRLDDAALQWSQLVESGGVSRDALPDSLRMMLEGRLKATNETTAIGIALARRLGLQRVHPIDDHLDKDLFLTIADDLSAELENSAAYRELVASGALEASTEDLVAAHETGDLLSFYLALNDLRALERNLDLEWRFFFRTRLASGLDRYRVALWEVRNLAMAQHIRRMSAPFPGGRLLVLVGASHKPFLDAYLSCGMDVEIIQLADIVGESR